MRIHATRHDVQRCLALQPPSWSRANMKRCVLAIALLGFPACGDVESPGVSESSGDADSDSGAGLFSWRARNDRLTLPKPSSTKTQRRARVAAGDAARDLAPESASVVPVAGQGGRRRHRHRSTWRARGHASQRRDLQLAVVELASTASRRRRGGPDVAQLLALTKELEAVKHKLRVANAIIGLQKKRERAWA